MYIAKTKREDFQIKFDLIYLLYNKKYYMHKHLKYLYFYYKTPNIKINA